ncbi:hypothetical protein GIW70_19000, partial [Pseudomonas syringae]|nr:hypothetical protein [Pseudomonas syringae]
MQAFHAVFLTGCLFAVTSAQALDSNFNYYGPNQPFAHPAPPSLNSTPLRTFDDTAPQDFIIIPSDHEFYDSQLPIVADAT